MIKHFRYSGCFGKKGRAFSLALATGLLLSVLPARAQLVPECSSAKLKREGQAAAKVLKCYVKAAGKQQAVDPDCLQKAMEKLNAGFTKAEEDGPCYDGRGFEWSLITEVRTALASMLYPPPLSTDAEFTCAAAKLKGAAKLALKKIGCHAKAAKKGQAVESDCLQTADAKFAVAFQEVEAAGGCATLGDASQTKLFIDQLVNSAVALLTADQVPIRCCSASATFTPKPPSPPIPIPVTGCGDYTLGTCEQAAVLLAPAGGSAVTGAPGSVCDGASGSCQALRIGTSACCEVTATDGTQICAEIPSPIVAALGGCGAFNGQVSGLTFMSTPGAVCTQSLPSQPECVP